jgi:hypothetical protein
MKEIDILNGIANGEIKPGFKIKSKTGNIYEYIEGKGHFVNVKDEIYVWTLGDFTRLNEEIEVLEEDKEIEELEGTLLEVDEDSNLDTQILSCLANKINELVKAVNELKKGK